MEVEQGSPQARATMGSLHHLTSSCTSCSNLSVLDEFTSSSIIHAFILFSF